MAVELNVAAAFFVLATRAASPMNTAGLNAAPQERVFT